jgi:uncharacterized membrane protein YbhN (UPF0104 family)
MRRGGALRLLWRVAQIALAAVVLWLAWRTVAGQWGSIRVSAASLRPSIGGLVLSGAVVLAAYALLVETWRRMLAAWGERLPFWAAARIWFLSSFGKYVPGKVWAISAMTVMSGRAGVSPVAAAGSSIIVQLLNIAAGVAVIVVAGGQAMRGQFAWARPVAITALALALLGLAAAPLLLPPLLRLAARIMGRPLAARALPASALWTTAAANVVAWLLYGVAFRLFTAATLGEATGATAGYIAVYTLSYLFGYLAVFAPGGVGVREGALVALMPQLGLASVGDAVLLAALSRLWLTILEIVPGLLFLARDGLRARTTRTVDDGSS